MAASKQLDKARAAVKKKNYEYAAELYVLHLKMHPDDVDARKECRGAERLKKKVSGGGTGFMAKAKAKKLEIQAASIRINKKDPEKTMGQCEELLKQDPDTIPALLRLGEAASYASHNEVAIYVFEDALSIDRANKDALRLLGRVQEGTGNLDKALKCFMRLNKLDPKDKEAADKVKRIPASITSKGYEEGAAKGGYKGLIDADEAKKLDQATKRVRTPEQALARIEDLKPNLKEDPKDTKTMRLIAELYVKAELPDKAEEWCNKALKLEPDNYLISELRGDLTLRRYEKALKKIKIAYKKTKSPELKSKYTQINKEYKNFEIDEYARRAASHPTEPGLNFPLGKALYDANRIDEAISALQKAKKDARKKSKTCYFLGQCFIKKKILNMALRELNTAREEIFEMDDLKKDITYLIARIYEGAKKAEKARSEYEKIAEVDFNYKDVTSRIEALSDDI